MGNSRVMVAIRDQEHLDGLVNLAYRMAVNPNVRSPRKRLGAGQKRASRWWQVMRFVILRLTSAIAGVLV